MFKLLLTFVLISSSAFSQDDFSKKLVAETAGQALFMQYYLNEVGIPNADLIDIEKIKNTNVATDKVSSVLNAAGIVSIVGGGLMAISGTLEGLRMGAGVKKGLSTSRAGTIIFSVGIAAVVTNSVYQSSFKKSSSEVQSDMRNAIESNGYEIEQLVKYVSSFTNLSTDEKSNLSSAIVDEINEQISNGIEQVNIPLFEIAENAGIISSREEKALESLHKDLINLKSNGSKELEADIVLNNELELFKSLESSLKSSLNSPSIGREQREEMKDFLTTIEELIVKIEYSKL